MAASTVYDVRVKYMLDDKASRGLANIGKQARRSAKSTGGLEKTLRRMAVGAVGYFGFRTAKKWLVDYNKEMEAARIKMATLVSMNMGGSWAKNQKRANFLVSQFTKDAAKGVGTTKDYVDFAGDITLPLLNAGASMEQLTELTKAGVTAAKTFGIEGAVAGRDVQQMLMGTVRSVDRLPRLLGVSAEEWNKMVRTKGPEETLRKLNEVLNTPEIQKAAEVYGKSWDGVTSTLEDNLQRAFGKVGIPLMQKLSAEMQKLNKWFEENPQKVKEITDAIANGLVKAFNMAKSIFGFIVRHRKLLLLLAKAYLVSRAAGGVAKMFQGIAGGLTKLGETGTGVASKLGAFGNKLGAAGTALGAFAIGASAVADAILEGQETTIKKTTANPRMREQMRLLGGASSTGTTLNIQKARARRAEEMGFKSDIGSAAAGVLGESTVEQFMKRQQALQSRKFTAADKLEAFHAVREAKRIGVLGKGGKVGVSTIAENLGVDTSGRSSDILLAAKTLAGGKKEFEKLTPGQMAEQLMKVNKVAGDTNISHMVEFLNGLDNVMEIDRRQSMVDRREYAYDFFREFELMSGGKMPTALGDEKGTVKAPKVNIGPVKIEVVSDDPDRFAFSLVGAFEDYMRSPTQAARAIRSK